MPLNMAVSALGELQENIAQRMHGLRTVWVSLAIGNTDTNTTGKFSSSMEVVLPRSFSPIRSIIWV